LDYAEKNLFKTNTLAYFANSSATKKKVFNIDQLKYLP
jgi:hypothetical protein